MPISARSHEGVCGAAAALRHGPADVLGGILDVAGLAVEAVLGVDLEPEPPAAALPLLGLHVFIHPRWAVPLLWAVVLRECTLVYPLLANELQVCGLVVVVVCAAPVERRRQVKGDLSVRGGVLDPLVALRLAEVVPVLLAVLEGPRRPGSSKRERERRIDVRIRFGGTALRSESWDPLTSP